MQREDVPQIVKIATTANRSTHCCCRTKCPAASFSRNTTIFKQRTKMAKVCTTPTSIAVVVRKNKIEEKSMQMEKELVPVRGFVEHVLWGSRIPIPILQAALCYLEAIRLKIPKLHKQDIVGGSTDSYSNRVWAKLSGVTLWEIGRCERALEDLLGWRLWVGKGVGVTNKI